MYDVAYPLQNTETACASKPWAPVAAVETGWLNARGARLKRYGQAAKRYTQEQPCFLKGWELGALRETCLP